MSRYFGGISASEPVQWARRTLRSVRPHGRLLLLAGVLLVLPLAPGHARSAVVEAQDSFVTGVGLSIIAATVLAFLGMIGRVPLLLTYLAAGMVLKTALVAGPQVGLNVALDESDIRTISRIGLVLLLFIIGLDIDIRRLKDAGRALLAAGVSQFLLCAALGFAFFSWLGFALGDGSYEVLYLSVCCAISSTTVVAKLLYDKFELNTLPGQLTIGVLLFQNIWVMLFFRIQPNLGQSVLIEAVLAVAKGASLVLASLLLSRFVLPYIFKRVAKIPELLLVASLGWCFLVAGIAGSLNLSAEVGALIAGASLATFPYASDMAGKISSVRDFFLTLFFVALGMQIPNPVENPDLLYRAFFVAGFVILSRYVAMYPVLYLLRQGHRVSLLVPTNLAQTSEIGLLVATIGLSKGHIDQDILDIIIYVFVMTSAISSYLIKYNHQVQQALGRLLVKIGLPDIGSVEAAKDNAPQKEIAILGFYQVASSLIEEIQRTSAPLKDKLVVVDFNPQVHEKLQGIGVKVIYGDISQWDTLSQAGIDQAKVVLSTVPDSVLRGTDNVKLIKQIQRLCPKAKIIVTAESPPRALKMYEEGADYVLLPRVEAAKHLIPVIDGLRAGGRAEMRLLEVLSLRERKEVIN